MPSSIDVSKAALEARLRLAGHLFSTRRLGTGDFGDGIEIEATIHGRNAVVDFWSRGLEGQGMISYVVFEEVAIGGTESMVTEMVVPEVWLHVGGEPQRLADQVFVAITAKPDS